MNFYNREEVGKTLLKKAAIKLIGGELQCAYEALREGLTFVTCDCSNGGWLGEEDSRLNEMRSFIFKDLALYQDYKEDTVSAFFLYYFDEEVSALNLGLRKVERALKSVSDEKTMYIKARLLWRMKRYDESKVLLELCQKMEINARNEYRLGDIMEDNLNQVGLELLKSSFLKNIHSTCCANRLQEHSYIRGVNVAHMNYPKAKKEDVDNKVLNYFVCCQNWTNFAFEYRDALERNKKFEKLYPFQLTPELQYFIEKIASTDEFNITNEKAPRRPTLNQSSYASGYNWRKDGDNLTFYALTDGLDVDYDNWSSNGGDISDLKDQLGY